MDPTCDRCRQAPASLLHMFWLCPTLMGYWKLIFNYMSVALGSVINPCPLVALFGLSPKTANLSNLHNGALAFCTLIARRLILLNWKSSQPPTNIHWIRDLMSCIHLENIRYLRDGKQDEFRTIWNPFISYFSSIKATGITPTLPSLS